MRNPEVLLGNLKKHSNEANYKYEKLYRNLYNQELMLLAYKNISGNYGATTPGYDGQTVDNMTLERINKVIESLKDLSYKPMPAKRVYIPKKNGSKRPLGLPSANDKIIQEAVRMILESIYEGNFSENSHGFRRERSCHTALSQIKSNFTGAKWLLEGDIKGFFDNIDHHILIKLLRKRIKDERFIELIWKFLKAGYVEDWKWHGTYSGTPQGGIISPILANIYLHELDKYVEQLANEFFKGKDRKKYRPYLNAQQNVRRNKLRLKDPELSEKERKILLEKIRDNEMKWRNLPAMDPMDSNYKRLQYVRYADDFLIGVIGDKKDAEDIKKELTEFLSNNLKLELSQEKTLITHNKEKARFLGYDISVFKPSYSTKKYSGLIKLEMPREAWVNKLIHYKAIDMRQKIWKPTHRPYLEVVDELEIVSTYNAEIRGLYNYYKYANNVAFEMHKFYFFMKWSFLKTLAGKYRSSVAKQHKRLQKEGRLVVAYETKKGVKELAFYDGGFPKDRILIKVSNNSMDNVAKTFNYSSINSLGDRLKAGKCEVCGSSNKKIHMHHTKRLKDLRGKNLTRYEYLMIARNRKTIAVCEECHLKYHNGNYKK